MSETKFDGSTAFIHIDRYQELLESEGQLLELKKGGAETPTATRVEEILNEREKTHGKFEDVAAISDILKFDMQRSSNWPTLGSMKREALDMIAHKIGRILAGDSNVKDHWDDIAGYAKLISRELQ